MERLEGGARNVDCQQRADVLRAAFPDWRTPWSARSFEDYATDPRIFWVEARSIDDAFAGLAIARCIGDEAELLTIFRTLEMRGRGVGSLLTKSVIEHFKSQQIHRIVLEVAQNNESALALYERFRFKKIGERPGYYLTSDGIRVDAYILSLDFCVPK